MALLAVGGVQWAVRLPGGARQERDTDFPLVLSPARGVERCGVTAAVFVLRSLPFPPPSQEL